MLSLARSLEIYQDLDNLLKQVIGSVSRFADLDLSIRTAFKKGKLKHVKYIKELSKNAIVYAAHTLDPRYKTLIIKDIMPD